MPPKRSQSLLILMLILALFFPAPKSVVKVQSAMIHEKLQQNFQQWMKKDFDLDACERVIEACAEWAREDNEVVATLRDWLKSQDEDRKAFALCVLGTLGARAQIAIPGVLDLILDPFQSRSLRGMAGHTLGHIGKPAIGALATLLTNSDRDIRQWAADGLCRNAPVEVDAIPPLFTCFHDADEQLRLIAVEAVEQFDSRANPFFKQVFRTGAPRDRVFALYFLAKTDRHFVLKQRDALKSYFLDPDPVVRSQASATISELNIDATEFVLMLCKGLTDPDHDVRYHAADALAHFGPNAKAAIPALSHALTDDDEFVRTSAATALGRMASDAASAVAPLIAALHDESGMVRVTVITALGEIGPAARESIPALKELSRRSPEDNELIRRVIKQLSNK